MVSAYIMPHPPIARPAVGRGEEKKISSTLEAYRTCAARIAQEAPETIIVLSPHNTVLSDAITINPGDVYQEDLGVFGAPQDKIRLEYDVPLREEIIRLCKEADIPVYTGNYHGRNPDHGTVVPLLFVAEQYTGFRIVRIASSFLPDAKLEQMGNILERAAAHMDRRVTILASGDLSHKLLKEGPYGFIKEGPVFDKTITDIMKSGDLHKCLDIPEALRNDSAQCGLQDFIMLSGALQNYCVTPEFLSYEGPFGVGYALCAFSCTDKFVELARRATQTYLSEHRSLGLSDASVVSLALPDWALQKKNGVFVSLHNHKTKELRGCIGTLETARYSIAEKIIMMAESASTRDYRFVPVKAQELPELEMHVDILSDTEPATPDALDVRRYGVTVACRGRFGILLPDLEGVDTPEMQIAIALRKAGISASEKFTLERFTVERHK